MKDGLPRFLEQLQHLDAGLTDGQLFARFRDARDEASFAALVRRHGPMVLSVCRRVLRDFHDAEDAFQATFLVLAAKASSVLQRESVGSWLYTIAYNTALDAVRANARRHARERPMHDMPHPEAAPASPGDWRPLLDRELNRLSEKYRRAIVLCDLEGLPHKEAARVLGVPPGTVASRLNRARALLAKRLAARGLALSGGALAALLANDVASAQVPAALATSTARVAALVATGQLTAATGPAVVLMQGVMKAMLVKKLRLVIGSVMVAAALSGVGFACRFGEVALAQDGPQTVQEGPPPSTARSGRPTTDLESLRRENEDLRATVRVLVREINLLEQKLGDSRAGQGGGKSNPADPTSPQPRPRDGNAEKPQPNFPRSETAPPYSTQPVPTGNKPPADATPKPQAFDNAKPVDQWLKNAVQGTTSSAAREVEAALRQLREARNAEGRERAIEALERATKRLREEVSPGSSQQRE